MTWIKDLNVKANAIKFLERNITKYICDLGVDKGFSDKTKKAIITVKQKNDSLALIKIIISTHQKTSLRKLIGKIQNVKKYL